MKKIKCMLALLTILLLFVSIAPSTLWTPYIQSVNAAGILGEVFLLWSFTTAAEVRGVATGDLNGDGISDVAAASHDYNIYAIKSDGTKLWDFATSGSVICVAIGDLNGDGMNDVVGGGYDSYLYALDGLSGTLLSGWPKWAGGDYAHPIYDIQIGDFDGDGKDDVSSSTTGFGDVYAFRGYDGNQLWRHTHTNDVRDIGVGDINGDGKDDVAVGVWESLGEVYAYRGYDGTKLWGPYTLPKRAQAVDVGHVTGDSRCEVVAGMAQDLSSPEVYSISPGGALLWNAEAGYNVGAIKIGDLDGDGDNDVAVGTEHINENTVLMIDGSNGDTMRSVGFEDKIHSIDVGDLDDDGVNDIAAGGDYSKVWAIKSDGSILWSYSCGSWIYLHAIRIDDINGDGTKDVVAGSYDHKVYALSGKRPAEWTFMVYLDADNNLESEGIEDFLEMSEVGSSSAAVGISIVVQIDRSSGWWDHGEWKDNIEYDNWTDCKRFFIEEGMEPYPSEAIPGWGKEVNMGDPNTLIEFVQWTINSYPANNYILVLWDHGGGCKPGEGVCYDWYETPHDPIDMAELKQAMTSIKASLGKNIDILGFDACLMEMIEVAYQVTGTTDIMVGSEELIPGDGWPYDDILEDLVSNPSTSPNSLSSKIVNYYVSSYQGGSQAPPDINWVTLAAFYENQTANNVVPDVDSFAQQLIEKMSDYHSQITEARTNTESFNVRLSVNSRIYYDLYDFAYEIKQRISDTNVQTVAQNLMNSIDASRIGEPGHGPEHPDAHGLSIYWPTKDQYASDYENLDFAIDTKWDEFLNEYHDFVATLKVTAESPINLLVTDPNGLRVGYDPETGTVVNEISNAKYSGPCSEPQEITIPNPSHGTYIIDAFGTGSGLYTIIMKSTTANGTIIESETWNGTAVLDEQYTETVKLNVDGELTLFYANIAVTNVVPFKTTVGQGYCMNITATITNLGDFTESFNVSVFYDDIVIILLDGKNYTTTTLTSGNSTTLTFTWNTTGVAKGNYTITAKATQLPYETDTTDNTLTDGIVMVTFLGDVNGDGKVRIDDILAIALAFGSNCGEPKYESNLDINDDCKIRVDDILTAALNFGQG